MAEKSVIVTSGTTRATVITPGNITRVARVTVGRPVRRVVSGASSIQGLNDVDVSSLTNGSVLVYSSGSTRWVATLDLEEQNINGGSY